jgi:hypothetical protein
MKICFSLIIIFTSSLVLAVTKQKFSENVHLTTYGYLTDNAKSVAELRCDAYANLSDEGIKLELDFNFDLVYAVECKRDEIGTRFNLLVKSNNKLLTKLRNISYSGGDAGYSRKTQSWLIDINNDNYPDLVKRTFWSDTDSKPPTFSDELVIFYWDIALKKFQSQKISERLMSEYKRKFQLRLLSQYL